MFVMMSMMPMMKMVLAGDGDAGDLLEVDRYVGETCPSGMTCECAVLDADLVTERLACVHFCPNVDETSPNTDNCQCGAAS